MKVKLKCSCGKEFEREKGELNRSHRLGRLVFCSCSCSVSHSNKVSPRLNGILNFKNIPGTRSDEYSSFRWFVARAVQRRRLKGESNLTPQYLKQLWEKQNGICPYTGWTLILPPTTLGWTDKQSRMGQERRASLDRIDCSRG